MNGRKSDDEAYVDYSTRDEVETFAQIISGMP